MKKNTAPHGIFITAWLNKNDWPSGVMSVELHAASIGEVSPAWYRPDADGGVSPLPGSYARNPALLGIAADRNIPVCPLIMNAIGSVFAPSLVASILANRVQTARHAAAITDLVVANGYGGIIVDYENLAPEELPSLAQFVQGLAGALHAKNKTLGVTAAPKDLRPENTASWRAIARAADLVYLMAYPEHNTRSAPGPIASPRWVAAQTEKALALFPPDKLSLGLPTYAIAWGLKKNLSGSWASFISPALARNIKVRRDGGGEPYFNASVLGRKAQIWFEDAHSLKQKMADAEESGITHFALWRLGGEDPAIWPMIRSLPQ